MCAMSPRLLRPVASGFSPKRLSGLFGWYDASVASSVTMQTGVQSWSDLAGSMGAAIQNTTNDQPAYGSVTLNGKPTITFDGTDDFLRSGTFSLPQPYMMFAVYRFESSYVSAVRAMEMGNGSPRSGELIRVAADSQQLFAGVGVTFANYASGSLQAFGVHEAEVNGAESILRYNGTDAGAEQNAGTNDANQLTLGANRTGAGLSNISFAELIVYDRVLTASERQRVEGYLAWKWGFQAQLPYDHPYAASFPGFGSQATPTDADTLTYLAAVKAADGTGVEVGVANAVESFVTGCKSDGIWDAIKASCILAGARTLAGALVPLKGAAPTNNNFVSGDYNRETGLKADGTKYLNANRNNNADPQNSNHHAVYVSEADSSGTSGSYIDGGGTGTGANNIGRSSTVANLFLRNRCSTAGSVASGAATGLIGTNRSLAASYVVRASGTNTTITQASQTPADSAVFVFARPPSATSTTNARLAFYSIGESLDLALLDARVSSLITAIGNAI